MAVPLSQLANDRVAAGSVCARQTDQPSIPCPKERVKCQSRPTRQSVMETGPQERRGRWRSQDRSETRGLSPGLSRHWGGWCGFKTETNVQRRPRANRTTRFARASLALGLLRASIVWYVPARLSELWLLRGRADNPRPPLNHDHRRHGGGSMFSRRCSCRRYGPRARNSKQ